MGVNPDAIVRAARSWLGTPYRHQSSVRGAGADCLGLVRGVWRAVYGDEPELAPPYSPDWAEVGGAELMAEAAARHMDRIPNDTRGAGDLLLFRWRGHLPAKHAAILTAPWRMIHAHEGSGVCEVHLNGWWLRRLAYVFRFPDIES
ncbi:MAG: NlpC/P60 family protein [Pseudomonadota bacterium]